MRELNKKVIFVFLVIALVSPLLVHEARATDPNPNRYAVMVAINDYNGLSDLPYPVADITDWYYMFDETFTIEVLGDGTSAYPVPDPDLATEANIKSALSWLVNVADDDDSVAIIIIGHGDWSGGNNGWYETVNGENFDDDEFASYLDDIDASEILVFLDFCHSGTFIDDCLDISTNRLFLTTACRYDGLSWESNDYGHGLWTYFYLNYYSESPTLSQEVIYDRAYPDLVTELEEGKPAGYNITTDVPQKLVFGMPPFRFNIKDDVGDTSSTATDLGSGPGSPESWRKYFDEGLWGADVDWFCFTITGGTYNLELWATPSEGLDIRVKVYDSGLNQKAYFNSGGTNQQEHGTVSWLSGKIYIYLYDSSGASGGEYDLKIRVYS